ncbi:cation:proton antiporter [Methanofollis ethanolicus]|uniref:cation:proton antiporter n=1 Tax=Methanofollis ethanolicus TaxID=488124 RepID=UPI00083536E7|nr:cation:proton antiporter [Methanofollis ethanolicus]
MEAEILFLTAFTGVLFLYSLVSRRIETTVVTAPMVFLTAGLVLGPGVLDIAPIAADAGFVLFLGEFALVLLLFSDASRINIAALRGGADLPARLLVIGLPLTIMAGTIAAALLFTDLTLLEAAILGCLLAPTDAALGEAVVSSKRVPLRIRQALNVEAGLNDGAVIPVLTVLWAVMVAEEQMHTAGYWIASSVVQIVTAVTVGAAIGLAGGWLVSRAKKNQWMEQTYEWIALMAVAVLAWILTDILGGSGFIAAFVAGLAAGAVYRQVVASLIEFTVAEGEILGHIVFFILGAISYLLIENFSLEIVFYAVLSLTLVRMLPVALSLIGKGLSGKTVLFMGWFGPRGLASVVLLLITIEEVGDAPGMQTIVSVVIATVVLSVFAHGISANPAIRAYGRHAETLHARTPEKETVAEVPGRRG